MIETRRLTRDEVEQLIKDAPDSETRNLKAALIDDDMAYAFLDYYGIDHWGLLSDGKPIYMVALTRDENGRHELWTVANKDIKEQFSLYKYCKRSVGGWLEKYGKIYATMEKSNSKNLEWTKRIGFKKVSETTNTITLVMDKTNNVSDVTEKET